MRLPVLTLDQTSLNVTSLCSLNCRIDQTFTATHRMEEELLRGQALCANKGKERAQRRESKEGKKGKESVSRWDALSRLEHVTDETRGSRNVRESVKLLIHRTRKKKKQQESPHEKSKDQKRRDCYCKINK